MTIALRSNVARRVWCWASPSGFSRFRFSFPHRDLARPRLGKGGGEGNGGGGNGGGNGGGGEARGSVGAALLPRPASTKERTGPWSSAAARLPRAAMRGQSANRHPRRIPERPPRGEEAARSMRVPARNPRRPAPRRAGKCTRRKPGRRSRQRRPPPRRRSRRRAPPIISRDPCRECLAAGLERASAKFARSANCVNTKGPDGRDYRRKSGSERREAE